MAPVTVSNSYVGNNPDYSVKVTDVNSVVQPGNVQHVIVDSLSATLSLTVPDNYTSSALEASAVVKATAGTLFVISGYSTVDQYIQVFDSASLPIDGAIPTIVIVASAGSTFGYTAPLAGRAFDNGITICNSSTGPSKTIGGATCLFDVQFI